MADRMEQLKEACESHEKHGCCVDESRSSVVCTELGSNCNNCGADMAYCSETNVHKHSCNCCDDKDKWVPGYEDEL